MKPLLWGAVSIFSAACAVTTTVHLDAEPSIFNSEFEGMFDCLSSPVHELIYFAQLIPQRQLLSLIPFVYHQRFLCLNSHSLVLG